VAPLFTTKLKKLGEKYPPGRALKNERVLSPRGTPFKKRAFYFTCKKLSPLPPKYLEKGISPNPWGKKGKTSLP